MGVAWASACVLFVGREVLLLGACCTWGAADLFTGSAVLLSGRDVLLTGRELLFCGAERLVLFLVSSLFWAYDAADLD